MLRCNMDLRAMASGPLRRWLLGLIACIIASLASIQWGGHGSVRNQPLDPG